MESEPEATTRLRTRAAVCIAAALIAAAWSVWRIDVLPPGLTPRALEMATASTSIVVESETPAIVNERLDTYGFADLTDRAVLLGSVMSDGPGRRAIAQAAGVPADRLVVAAPITRTQPRVAVEPGKDKKASDLFSSNDRYRLYLEVNPTVPILEVTAQAPDARHAERLANAAFDASDAYVTGLANREGTPGRVRMVVRQLGRAEGTVVNEGIQLQIAAIAFVLGFGSTAVLMLVGARIRRGWRVALLTERAAGA